MAVVKGISSGFVSVSPTADPEGSADTCDSTSIVVKDTSPSTATKITEIGWWCDNATQESNFEVGLYSADGAGGGAATRLFVSSTNAKGTTAGWKKVTVDWSISPNTIYWIGMQLDDTLTSTALNITANAAGTIDQKGAQTTLPSPWGTVSIFNGFHYSVYAVWAAVSGPANLKSYNTNLKANIKSINGNPIANIKSLDTNV